MITAVDSSVLLDVLTADPRHLEASLAALRSASEQGKLVACPVVWAEVRACFSDAQAMETAFAQAGIEFDGCDQACAEEAGAVWRSYRASGGSGERMIADFLVAAHAKVRAHRLLTRDRGFFRRYFRGLDLLEPGLRPAAS